MSLLNFVGYVLIIYGPIFNMFMWTIADSAEAIILAMISAFLWFGSIFLASCVYAIAKNLIITPALYIVSAVVFQELCRTSIFFSVSEITKRSTLQSSDERQTNDTTNPDLMHRKMGFSNSISTGIGFAVASAMFTTINIVTQHVGPGHIGIEGNPPSFMIVTAFSTLILELLNVIWNILFFHGLYTLRSGQPTDKLSSSLSILYVMLSHVAVSFGTLFNRTSKYGGSIGLFVVILAISMATCFFVLRTSWIFGGSLAMNVASTELTEDTINDKSE